MKASDENNDSDDETNEREFDDYNYDEKDSEEFDDESSQTSFTATEQSLAHAENNN